MPGSRRQPGQAAAARRTKPRASFSARSCLAAARRATASGLLSSLAPLRLHRFHALGLHTVFQLESHNTHRLHRFHALGLHTLKVQLESHNLQTCACAQACARTRYLRHKHRNTALNALEALY